jgi:hypothetical protein
MHLSHLGANLKTVALEIVALAFAIIQNSTFHFMADGKAEKLTF